jgi:uncharacterized repeat protein (TIGR03803 family)
MIPSLKGIVPTGVYALTILLYIAISNCAAAQTFELLHPFAVTSDPTSQSFGGTNLEGAYPYGVIFSSNVLYGTALGGGISNGAVFRINASGTGFTNLHSFSATSGPAATNGDGTFPFGTLIESGASLYGTANTGGKWGNGTIFSLRANGTGFTNLHSFSPLQSVLNTNSDGAFPQGDFILSGNTLFGTAQYGGALGGGVVFRIDTNGHSFTNLHSFSYPLGSNAGGSSPLSGVTISSNVLFGVTWRGGTGGQGCVFRVNTDGSGFTNLHSFTDLTGITNDDGAQPQGVIVSGGTIYGTAGWGGSAGNGVIFAMQTDGTGFRTLHQFSATASNSVGNLTNADGAQPNTSLVLSGNTLFGMASGGGEAGNGGVFSIAIDGTQFTPLYYFSAPSGNPLTNNDGVLTNPQGELAISGRTIYGVADFGGQFGSGTVFSVLVPPALAIAKVSSGVILSWPTNATGFVLQSSGSLASNSWVTASTNPGVLGDQFVVTNSVTNTSMFYRLAY